MPARDDERYEHLLAVRAARAQPAAGSLPDLVRQTFEATPGTPAAQVVRTYPSSGRFSQSLTVYELRDPGSGEVLGSTVEKVVARPADNEPAWLSEALFYAELRDRLSLPGLHIPELHHLKVPGRDMVALYLEHVEGAEPIRRHRGRKHAAWIFGQLAGRAHAERLYETGWLPQATGVGAGGALVTRLLPRALELVGMLFDGAERERVAAALQQYFEDAPVLEAMYHQCQPTLAHGDANHENVRGPDGDGPVDVVVVDWPRVHHGRIGDDLARIVMPWLVLESGERTEEALRELETSLVDLYRHGAEKHAASVDAASLRYAYELHSVRTTVALAPYLIQALQRRWRTRKRLDALRGWFAILAERAGSLRTQAGAQPVLTSRYLGEDAVEYDKNRANSSRWRLEYKIVRRFLLRYPAGRVFDCPVGTGRFIPIYRELGWRLVGADISEDMLAEAKSKAIAHRYEPERLVVADATTLDPAEFACDVAVAVRFLNWLPPVAAARAFANIAASASEAVIVSLTTTDRVHVQVAPPDDGKPPNWPHRKADFEEWVSRAGFEIAATDEVLQGKGSLSNHVYLLTRRGDEAA